MSAILLDQLADLRKRKESSLLEQWRSVVAAMAAGRSVDLEKVDRLLTEMDADPSLLTRAVDNHEYRVELRREFDKLPDVEAEQTRVSSAQTRANLELEAERSRAESILRAAEEKHARATKDLNPTRERLVDAFGAIERAKQDLQSSCLHPPIVARLKAARQAADEARAEQHRWGGVDASRASRCMAKATEHEQEYKAALIAALEV